MLDAHVALAASNDLLCMMMIHSMFGKHNNSKMVGFKILFAFLVGETASFLKSIVKQSKTMLLTCIRNVLYVYTAEEFLVNFWRYEVMFIDGETGKRLIKVWTKNMKSFRFLGSKSHFSSLN